jgi:N-acyl-L-homoserine lactone synthetase
MVRHDDGRRARALDRLAQDMLDGLAPLAFRRTASLDEVEATMRLRRDAAVEMGWARPEDLPDGLERDADDAHAVHLVAVDDDALAGCLRLVPPGPGRALPTERGFEIAIDPPGSAVDAGRVVVAPSHRGGGAHRVLAGLVARAWLETRELGLDRVIGAASDQAIGLYRTLGMDVRALGPPREHWGELRTPIELTGAEDVVALALAAHDPGDMEAADDPFDEEPAAAGALTRSGLLARVGALSAGLLVVGVPQAVAAGAPARAGTGPTDRRTIDFIATIDQEARTLSTRGYLTKLDGIPVRALRTGPPAASTADPAASDTSAARLTLVSRATLRGISQLGTSITGHGAGTAEVHLLPAGGARLEDPASFAGGTLVAGLTLSFQHVLSVDTPDNAVATFSADMVQRSARAFTLAGKRYQIGRPGLPWSLRASGRGVRSEPTIPRSRFFIAGDLGVVDAAPVR